MKVSELNLKAKSLLEAHLSDIELSGELSKITLHSSGHWYFELKDESSSIACAMFKSANFKLNFKPSVGDKLILRGFVSLYEQSGRYQFIANFMQKDGFGDLEAKFLELKTRLEAEGLFDVSLKKPLPKFPKSVAIITSKTSAALQDMLKLVTQKECFLPKFSIFNALTQGNLAPTSLIKALEKADKMGFELIIIARGGGSREDLFCFNDESLARAIFRAKTPIISAIGHEIDYVISDFVADFRASTPSAAIECFSSKLSLEQGLDLLEDRLKTLFKAKFENFSKELESLEKSYKMQSLPLKIEQSLKQNKELLLNLKRALQNRLNVARLSLENLENSFFQHENFFKKSKNLVCIQKNGKISNLKELKSGDKIVLSSHNLSKEAQII